MLSPHDQGGRPWNPLLLLTGPRSSSLMTSWVSGSLASCCLFLAVVLGCCNRQGPIKKSPSEGETVGTARPSKEESAYCWLAKSHTMAGSSSALAGIGYFFLLKGVDPSTYCCWVLWPHSGQLIWGNNPVLARLVYRQMSISYRNVRVLQKTSAF